MRILFLLSCLEPAGSEMYCTALADTWRGKHEIFWISDSLHCGQDYLSMPIHRKAIPFGIINTYRVASFIRKNKIQLIHSHSRRAHWVAAQAAKMTNVPHVTTIHQPLPVHYFSRLFPCLGDQTIAIDEAVRDQLKSVFGQPESRIQLIRNGINVVDTAPSVRQAPKVKTVLIIGRLTGGRWKAFQFIVEQIERLSTTLPLVHFKVVGQIPDERRDELINRLSIAGSRIAPSTIATLGFVKDLPTLIRNSDGAIAAGRSALECIAQGRPTLLVGEGGVLGLCRPELWSAGLRTNFGDHIDPKDFRAPKFEAGLRDILTPKADQADAARWLRAQLETAFDIRKVAAQVEAVYQRLVR